MTQRRIGGQGDGAGGVLAAVMLAALFAAAWMALRWPLPEWMLGDNDWVHQLGGANQILRGEHPFLDWHTDYGPLRYYPSALAQWLLGPRTLAELLLVTVAYATAYGLLFRLCWRASGSRGVAVGLLVVALIVAPRLFKYYTTLGPVLCLWAAWRYIDRATWSALALLAATVVLAGLFRVDFGAFTGLGALVAVASEPGDWRARVRRSAALVGLGLVLVAPWIVWLVVHGALGAYLVDTLLVAPGHASAMSLPFPRYDAGVPILAPGNAVFLLYVCYWALPAVSLAAVLWPGVCPDVGERRRMVTTAVLAQAVLLHAAHRSDYSHLLQAMPIGFVLLAWLAGRLWAPAAARRASGPRLRPAAVAVGIAVGAALWAGVRVSGWPSPHAGEGLAALRLHALPRDALVQQLALKVPDDPRVQALVYLQRCTGANDRIIALPPWVGLYYFADRRFAGGQPNWSPGFFSAVSDQQRWIETVQRQGADLVFGDFSRVLDGRDERRFETYSPLVSEYVATQYVPIGSFGPLPLRARRRGGDVPAAADGLPPCLPPRVAAAP